MNNKKILILMGKSACGKDSIANYLATNYNFNKTISFTTRPMREGETEGNEYFFTNKNIFTDMILHNEMIEYRSYSTLVNGNSDVWYYGTHKDKNNIDLSKNNVMILDYEGALNALKYFGNNCYIVYIDVDDDIRTQRAKQRGSFDETEWNRRLKADDEDFKWNKIKNIVDLIITNENKSIEQVCEEIVTKGESNNGNMEYYSTYEW